MLMAVTGRETPMKIFEAERKCLVSFLDISNNNITKAYLKLAWNAGAIGARDSYVVTVKTVNHIKSLNFTEIFDFKRMLIATSVLVCKTKSAVLEIMLILIAGKHKEISNSQ